MRPFLASKHRTNRNEPHPIPLHTGCPGIDYPAQSISPPVLIRPAGNPYSTEHHWQQPTTTLKFNG